MATTSSATPPLRSASRPFLLAQMSSRATTDSRCVLALPPDMQRPSSAHMASSR